MDIKPTPTNAERRAAWAAKYYIFVNCPPNTWKWKWIKYGQPNGETYARS